MDNIRPDLFQPLTDTKEKYLCCLCCRSGPIRVSVTIQKQVYHPGEHIVFSVEVDNRATSRRLGMIQAALLAKYTLLDTDGKRVTRCYEEVLFVQLTENMREGSKKKWQDRTPNIPEDTTPSFVNCKCMHLNYKFVVNVQISSAFDTHVSLPVIITSNGPQTVQPVSQCRSTCEEISIASHFPSADHSPPIGYPQSTSHPLESIIQQPTGTIHTTSPTVTHGGQYSS